MCKKLVLVVVVSVLFSPLLFSDMPSGGGMGPSGGMTRSEGRRNGNDSDQGKKQVEAISIKKDNVEDLLTFETKLGLTSQQDVLIHMIISDAKQEAIEKASAVTKWQEEFTKSLGQITPDFANIHATLNKLTEAQANVQAVSVTAYEKAYALLTDHQKTMLTFFKTIRQQAMEAKAAADAQQNEQTPRSPNSSQTPGNSNFGSPTTSTTTTGSPSTSSPSTSTSSTSNAFNNSLFNTPSTGNPSTSNTSTIKR
jgi:hypothetical protein